jgi:mannose/fructose/sorbose-specific phosphotransferase system IID component
MSIVEGIALFIVTSISGIDSSIEEFQFHRPLIAATLVGIVLGNIKAAVMAGSALELVALGWMTIGASVSPDPALSGAAIAIIVILGKQSIGIALGIAIPLALAGQLIQIVEKSTIDVAIMHWAERGINEGKIKRINIAHYLTAIPSALRVSIPAVIIAVFADATIVQNFLNSIPKAVTLGIQISSGFMVVVGYAMIIQLLKMKELLPFFFIGFLSMTFTNITLVGLSLLGLSLAIIYYHVYSMINNTDNRSRRTRVLKSESEDKKDKSAVKIEKKDLMKVFWRTQIYQLSWNYERLQNLCYCYCILPILIKLNKDEEDLKTAVLRHLEYFNTHQFTSSAILGVDIAMEEAKANGEDFDNDAIAQIKIALMSPLAGIGDPIFWGTIRPIAAAIGAGIAIEGSLLGPILFFAIINCVRLFMRYSSLMMAYNKGVSLIANMRNFIPKLRNVLTVLSYTIMGGLVAKWTYINVPVVIYSYIKDGKLVNITLQHQLDTIMPNLLPLVLTFAVAWLLKKRIPPLICMLLLMLLGIVGYTFGFLA